MNVAQTHSLPSLAHHLAPLGFNPIPRREQITTNRDMSGPKFLYLAENWQVENWINGAKGIPIKRASSYLSQERKGTLTPDENLIHDSDIDLLSFASTVYLGGTSECVVSSDNVGIPNFVISKAELRVEDGLILCFSNSKSSEICQRLGKKFCLQIDDMAHLKSVIDACLGNVGTPGHCDYTDDHQRNHFLKSVEDKWMDEFRLLWPVQDVDTFDLPPNIAKLVAL